MPYHLFQYPLPGPTDMGELNTFLSTHRIVSVREEVLTTPSGALLIFVVQSVEGAAPPTGGSKRIDYKTVLNPEQFVLFCQLREERKRIAESEGVPIYTVFTNEQLAEMVRGPVRTLGEMAQLEGVGPARLEKHGTRFLSLLVPNPPAKTIPASVS